MAVRQARRPQGRRSAGADAEQPCVDRPRDGLDFARGVLLAVVLSVPLWSIVVALVIVVLRAQ